MQVQPPPEVLRVSTVQVACDGSGEIDPALGHPRVYLQIDPERGFVECGYCDRRFVLAAGSEGHESERLAPGVYEGAGVH